jgi:hypothetical protein
MTAHAMAPAVAEQLGEPAFVARVRLRAARRVAWLRHLWATQPAEGQAWLAVTHAEVDRILAGPDELAAAEAEFRVRDATCLALRGPIETMDARAASEEPWAGLCRSLNLSPEESDLAALAVAAGLDPLLPRLYGYLQDEVNGAPASAALARSLFDWSPAMGLRREPRLLTNGVAHPAQPGADPSAPATGWEADPLLLRWVRTGRASPTALGPGLELLAAPRLPVLYPDALARMQRFAASGGPMVVIDLVGASGSGKRTLAAQLAGALGGALLAANLPALSPPNAPPEQARRAGARITLALRLTGAAAVYLHEIDSAEEHQLIADTPIAVLGHTTPPTRTRGHGIARLEIVLPPLDRPARTRVWKALTSRRAPAGLLSLPLSPGELEEATLVAAAGADEVMARARALLTVQPSDLLGRLPQPYRWDDIVLPDGLRRHLSEFEAQARLRHVVYDEWGLARLTPLGRGITALFAGPSGTGKTMAAQVISRELGLELYRVDLSGVVNKYIGETEKRLRRVFDQCERANVLLFFDEADALFGQRTQVKDAHDRFANIEIDYLLQRMEQFDGVAVLATNRKDDLDQAFLRRLRFIVNFLAPGPAERLRLWQRTLPERSIDGTPLLGDIDFDMLADRLDMTGADITAAALAASFLAFAEGDRIQMRHVVHAAHRELTKHGIEPRLEGDQP